MKDKTTLELAQRLNEILKLTQSAELEKLRIDHTIRQLDDEWDKICYELWERIPKLQNDTDIRPKRRVKQLGERDKNV